MKNYILILGLFLSFISPSYGQMTIGHIFSGCAFGYTAEIVDLSISGKKIAILRNQNTAAKDTIFYYNLDYSFWKMIPCPILPNSICFFGLGSDVLYSSETLFNSDPLLEAAVYYKYTDTITNSYYSNLYIINENGVLTDSLTKLGSDFKVHEINSTTFIATVSYVSSTLSTFSGIETINLPGTLPCDICGGLGLAKTEEKPTNILSSPIPNPSKDQVKITFTGCISNFRR